ncbi:uncharacterized protein LOC113797840 [Dermatophagoides pteronyssinus]|uniref:uncharacterized protein LOC113797840 n=1 Tax=Dermatophagoides pteronyssinus TaxID=6956 RepID=UPI003F66BB46
MKIPLFLIKYYLKSQQYHIRIGHIFKQGFQCWNYFGTRMEFTMFDYEQQTLRYRFTWNNFWSSNFDYDDNKLQPKFHNYLINFYAITTILSTICHQISAIVILCSYPIFVHYSVHLFNINQITLIQLILTFFGYLALLIHIIFMMGQLFRAMNFIVVSVEFSKVQIKQFFSSLKLLRNYNSFGTDHHSISFIQNSILFLSRQQFEYVKQYADVTKVNRTASPYFVYDEMISKSSIIMACLFTSRQLQMNLFNLCIIPGLLSMFFYTTGLYQSVSNLPLYNQRSARLISQWLAKFQWLSSSIKNKAINRRFSQAYLRYLIKLNLFIQTMPNNKFGFSCGRLFFITKFKYIQLFILNFHLTIKFYKKICMSPQ